MFHVKYIFRPFTVYWNIPSFMCRQYNLSPVDLTVKYGIVQNDNDDFE